MSMNIMHNRLSRLAIAFLALSAGACANPVEDDHEEHPVGFVILNAQSQVELARFSGTAVTGQISVARGSATTLTVAAISEDGDRIAIDGDELGLQVVVTGGVATAVVQNDNQVVVTGTQAGTGALEIAVTHEGHEEFKRPVVLVVTP